MPLHHSPKGCHSSSFWRDEDALSMHECASVYWCSAAGCLSPISSSLLCGFGVVSQDGGGGEWQDNRVTYSRSTYKHSSPSVHPKAALICSAALPLSIMAKMERGVSQKDGEGMREVNYRNYEAVPLSEKQETTPILHGIMQPTEVLAG